MYNVWICGPCGQALRRSDERYIFVWTWRERYSAYVGGMSTGIGEGLEGEQCGKQTTCLAAQEVEFEIECNPRDRAQDFCAQARTGGKGRSWTEPGYGQQEVEGLGGVMKRKFKQTHQMGGLVEEYEDERVNGSWLKREQEGLNRSWCSWCGRVVASTADRASLWT